MRGPILDERWYKHDAGVDTDRRRLDLTGGYIRRHRLLLLLGRTGRLAWKRVLRCTDSSPEETQRRDNKPMETHRLYAFALRVSIASRSAKNAGVG